RRSSDLGVGPWQRTGGNLPEAGGHPSRSASKHRRQCENSAGSWRRWTRGTGCRGQAQVRVARSAARSQAVRGGNRRVLSCNNNECKRGTGRVTATSVVHADAVAGGIANAASAYNTVPDLFNHPAFAASEPDNNPVPLDLRRLVVFA